MEAINEAAYISALQAISNNPDLEQLFNRILQWETDNPQKEEYQGWEWFQVHGDPRTLNRLVIKGILKVTIKTNKTTMYRTVDPKAIAKALDDYQGLVAQPEAEEEKIPDDIFNIIVGHEGKKEIIKRSLISEKPVSCLLWGSIASAKTLFLEELTRLPQSHFILGSSLTKAGIFEVLFNERPRYCIIDEIDKIDDQGNLAALLSLMERGIVVETKFRRHHTIRLKTWVFASANDITKIPRELRSRFVLLNFKDYAIDEFYEVVVTVLKEREDTTESLALYIAEKVVHELESRDVRDAVKTARLLKEKTKDEVNHIIDILKTQK